MINPKLTPIQVDHKEYGYVAFDFGTFFKIDVYHDNKLVGFTKIPHTVEREENTIKYLIRRMVKYGTTKCSVSNNKEFNHGGAG